MSRVSDLPFLAPPEVHIPRLYSHHRISRVHRQYRGVVAGQVRYVTVAYHNAGDEILLDTLSSMIRQSGLSKRLFRK